MYSFSYWEPCCLEPCLESVFPCPVLTVASWPAYRFLKRQIRCPSLSGFSTVYCDPHKGFGIVNKAERDGFLEFSCFFDDPADVLVPLPFLNSAWTSGSSWFMYCWSLAWGILSITFLACEMSVIVQYLEHSLALPFLGIGMKTDLLQSCGHCWVFHICWHIEHLLLSPSSPTFNLS